MSIASEAGIECLTAKVTNDRALLQESSEITFSDEDMEVGYPDHMKPLYLAAFINQIPIKRALVDTGASVNLIPLSTLQATGILERNIQGCLMEVTGFGGRGEYTVDHIQLWYLSSIPRGKDRGLISCAFGEAMVAQTSVSPIHLSPMHKGKVE